MVFINAASLLCFALLRQGNVRCGATLGKSSSIIRKRDIVQCSYKRSCCAWLPQSVPSRSQASRRHGVLAAALRIARACERWRGRTRAGGHTSALRCSIIANACNSASLPSSCPSNATSGHSLHRRYTMQVSISQLLHPLWRLLRCIGI